SGSPGTERATLSFVHRPLDFARGLLTVLSSSASTPCHRFSPLISILVRGRNARGSHSRGRRLYLDKAISLPSQHLGVEAKILQFDARGQCRPNNRIGDGHAEFRGP